MVGEWGWLRPNVTSPVPDRVGTSTRPARNVRVTPTSTPIYTLGITVVPPCTLHFHSFPTLRYQQVLVVAWAGFDQVLFDTHSAYRIKQNLRVYVTTGLS